MPCQIKSGTTFFIQANLIIQELLSSFKHPYYSGTTFFIHTPWIFPVKPWWVDTGLVGEEDAVGVEGIGGGVAQQVGQVGGVDVCKPGQPSEKVGWVVVRPEQTSKVRVKQWLGEHPVGEIDARLVFVYNGCLFIMDMCVCL